MKYRTPLRISAANNGNGNSNSIEAHKQVIQWKKERTNSISTVLQTVNSLFDVRCQFQIAPVSKVIDIFSVVILKVTFFMTETCGERF